MYNKRYRPPAIVYYSITIELYEQIDAELWHCYTYVLLTLSHTRIKVSPRADAVRLEAKGIFPGAEVVRGHNWKFGDQDGVLLSVESSGSFKSLL